MVVDAHLEQEETSDDGEFTWKSIIDKSKQVNTIKVLEEAVVVAVTVVVTDEKPGGTGGTVGLGVVSVGLETRVYSYHSSIDSYGSGPVRPGRVRVEDLEVLRQLYLNRSFRILGRPVWVGPG